MLLGFCRAFKKVYIVVYSRSFTSFYIQSFTFLYIREDLCRRLRRFPSYIRFTLLLEKVSVVHLTKFLS